MKQLQVFWKLTFLPFEHKRRSKHST